MSQVLLSLLRRQQPQHHFQHQQHVFQYPQQPREYDINVDLGASGIITKGEDSSLDSYNDYKIQNFQTLAARMEFVRSKSQYDCHIKEIRGID